MPPQMWLIPGHRFLPPVIIATLCFPPVVDAACAPLELARGSATACVLITIRGCAHRAWSLIGETSQAARAPAIAKDYVAPIEPKND